MLYREIIAGFSENNTKHGNKMLATVYYFSLWNLPSCNVPRGIKDLTIS
jgi:hypothetical protein